MQRLIVDAEGKVTIPPEIIQKRGLRPGDEITLLETEYGLLVCQKGMALLDDWWSSLTTEEQREACQEAEAYEALSEDERDAIWNQSPLSIEEDAEGDEIDLSAIQLLFDKGVVRRIYEAQFRRSREKLPTPLQMDAVEVFARLRSPDKQLYITEESSHVLQQGVRGSEMIERRAPPSDQHEGNDSRTLEADR